MSIHHKVNDELVEFASKVSYTDSTANLDKRVTNNTTNISNNNTRIDSINSSITNLDSRVTNINTNVSGINTRIDSINSSITNLDKRVTNNTTNISNNNTRINSINSSITNLDSRVTNIEEHGSGGSTVSFDQTTMTLTIDGTPYAVSDGGSLASAITGKTLVQVAHIPVLPNKDYTPCYYTTKAAGWYQFCTSYNNLSGDTWNTGVLWSLILYVPEDGPNVPLITGWGSYWRYSLFLPTGFKVLLIAYKGTSETSNQSGTRHIYMYTEKKDDLEKKTT